MGVKFKSLFREEDDIEDDNTVKSYNEKGKKSNVVDEAEKSGNKMILFEPRAFSEAQQIVEHLKNNNSVVINLRRVPNDQRIIDFLSGCVYAIDGVMKRVDEGTYICVPKNISVHGKISEDGEKSKGSKKSSNEYDEDEDLRY